jgi:hypothetical protein
VERRAGNPGHAGGWEWGNTSAYALCIWRFVQHHVTCVASYLSDDSACRRFLHFLYRSIPMNRQQESYRQQQNSTLVYQLLFAYADLPLTVPLSGHSVPAVLGVPGQRAQLVLASFSAFLLAFSIAFLTNLPRRWKGHLKGRLFHTRSLGVIRSHCTTV